MSTKTKVKSYVSKAKTSVKQGWNKTVDYSKRKFNSAKNYATAYGRDINTAYSYGYSRGWNDAYGYPIRFGSHAVASYGYYRGSSDRHRVDVYNNRYRKHSKKKG